MGSIRGATSYVSRVTRSFSSVLQGFSTKNIMEQRLLRLLQFVINRTLQLARLNCNSKLLGNKFNDFATAYIDMPII